MASSARIPRGIDDFNPFIITTTAYLQMGDPNNAVRLGIVDSELADWKKLASDWQPLYLMYSDKKKSRTTAIKDQLLSIIQSCVDLDKDNRLLDRIAASPNVTIVDMETFNIKKGVLQKTTRTIPTTPITDAVTVTLQPLGGGSVSVKCYSITGTRASILEDADSVQYSYLIGLTPPTSIESAGMVKELSTKASFTLQLGAANSAKYLYIYFRWYDTKRPELSGPWSSLQSTLLL